ncbi:MAG: YlxR family protein [Chloroflexota bacterium]|nr:YlxR family protein [Chloroflexota bacterium]
MPKSSTNKGRRPKPVPQRTCVACRSTGPKRGLVRVVRLADGSVQVDETGKKPGRGAYLCATSACWDKALSGKTLEYALKTAINLENKASLLAYAATIEQRDERKEEPAERTDEQQAPAEG